MTGRADPFEHDDASYVLGLLTDAERAAFEVHLATCAACTERVRQLAAMPRALAGLTEDDFDESVVPAVPDLLLTGLLHRATASRRRRWWAVGTLAGVAAASILALVLVVSPIARPSSVGSPHPATGAVAMTAVTSTPLTATAALTDVPWGTRIELDCRYAATGSWSSDATYGLQAVDRKGVVHDLGTWTVHSGAETTFTSGTALARADVATLQITLADGTPILRLTS